MEETRLRLRMGNSPGNRGPQSTRVLAGDLPWPQREGQRLKTQGCRRGSECGTEWACWTPLPNSGLRLLCNWMKPKALKAHSEEKPPGWCSPAWNWALHPCAAETLALFSACRRPPRKSLDLGGPQRVWLGLAVLTATMLILRSGCAFRGPNLKLLVWQSLTKFSFEDVLT